MIRALFSDLIYRMRALFHRRSAERDLDDELRFHLDREAEKYVRAGVAPDKARRRARLALGGVEQTKESARDARGVRWIEIVLQDLRAAARSLRAQPTFTAIAAGSLAVGISMGAATATMIATVRYHALPFPTPDRVVAFYKGHRVAYSTLPWTISTAVLNALGERGDRVTAVGASIPAIGTIRTDTRATVALGDIVTPSFTTLLGVRPLLGRTFRPGDADPGAPPVFMLEQRFWIARFGGDASMIDRPLTFNGKAYTLIGIYPSDQQLQERTSFLVAKSLPAMLADSQTTVLGLALLAPGATAAGVNAELSALAPRDSTHRTPYGAATLREYLLAALDGPLLFLRVIGILVAIIAGVNFATLVLGRGMRRREELGIRAALGASTRRLVLHMLAECVLLSLAGGLLGSVLAPLLIHVLGALLPVQLMPPWFHATWTVPAALAAVALALVVGLVFGLAPAIELARPATAGFLLGGSSRDAGARRQRRGRRLLVSFEVGISVWAIVAIAGMAGVSPFAGMGDPGFDQTNRFSGSVGATSRDTTWRSVDNRTALLGAVRRAPGVVAAALSLTTYVDDVHLDTSTVAGGTALVNGLPPVGGVWIRVSPEFFRARGLHLLAGRFPSDDELARADPVAVVTANIAAQAAGDTSAGWRVHIRPRDGASTTVTVVGVVADVRQDLRGNKPLSRLYTPYFPERPIRTTDGKRPASSDTWQSVWILGTSSSHRIATDVYAALNRYDPGALVADITPVADENTAEVRQFLLLVVLAAGLFAIALGLASLGIYGIIAYAAATRRKEMAVRFALGAMRSHVGFLVVREAAAQVAIGLVGGIVGGLLTAQRLVPTNHALKSPPISVIVIAVACLAITLFAAAVAPVRRVWRANPATVLREDG